MTQQEYEQKRAECWHKYFSTDKRLTTTHEHEISKDAFYSSFDRAYALGREKEAITQADVEKVAEKYATHKTEQDVPESYGNMRLRRVAMLFDSYDIEQAFEDGANFALGKSRSLYD